MKCLHRHITQMLCLFVLIACQFESQAQHYEISRRSMKYFEKALSAYQNHQSEESLRWLEKAIEADTLNLDAYRLLSDVSKDVNRPDLMKLALSKIFVLEIPVNHQVLNSLASLHEQSGEFEQARECLEMLVQLEPDHQMAALRLERCKQLLLLLQHPLPVEMLPIGPTVNTKNHEYWPLISADDSTLYFTRLMSSEKQFSFERLYFSEKKDSAWSKPKMLMLDENELVNEGTLSMTADGRIIFISSCGRAGGLGSCDLYYFILINEKWEGPINAGPAINSKYWDAQPSVSASGELLFFSSNRPGGLGSRDLWVSKVKKNHRGRLEFSVPVNLGSHVNTKFDDFSPFIHADNQTLYFASEGHLNFGTSDVFMARLKNQEWSEVTNLGYPINSVATDDGMVVSPTAGTAILSSNREGSMNQSKDLYQFQLPEAFLPQKLAYVKGFVYHAETLEKLEVLIRLIDLDDFSVQEIEADRKKGYLVLLKENKTYALHVEAPGFLLHSEHFNLTEPAELERAFIKDLFLHPVKNDLRLVLSNVFFDYDSHILKPASAPELNELIRFLKLNPTLKIEISGHTDNQGAHAYNLELSLKRAETIAAYLSKEVNAERITVAGYGALFPIGNNETEEGRSKNRRCEMRILSQ